MSPRKTRSSNAPPRPKAAEPSSQKNRKAADAKADAARKQAELDEVVNKREQAIEKVALLEKQMVAGAAAAKEKRSKLDIPLYGPRGQSGLLERTYSLHDINDEVAVEAWKKRTLAQREQDSRELESVSEAETVAAAPRSPSRILDPTDSSELSEPEPEPEPTPKPPKKRRRKASPEAPLRERIDAAKKVTSSRGDSVSDTDAVPDMGSARDVGPRNDPEDRMSLDEDAELVNNWGNPHRAKQTVQAQAPAPHTATARTHAVPPSPFGAGTRQELKTHPNLLQKKPKGPPRSTVKGPPAFPSDTEESERQAAVSSPMKGAGVRLTSRNLVQINDIDVTTPKPKKLTNIKVKVESPVTPGVIILEDSPDKAQTLVKKTKKDGKSSRRTKEEKQPAKEDDGDDEGEERVKAKSQAKAREKAMAKAKAMTIVKAKARSNGKGKEAEDASSSNEEGATLVARPDDEHKKGTKRRSSTPDSSGYEEDHVEPNPFLKVPSSKKPLSTTSNTSTSSTVKMKYKLKDLPGGPRVQDLWTNVFLPTLIRFIGTRLRPWSIDDTTSVVVVQSIWDVVFGAELPRRIESGDVVHYLATRKLNDWRSDLGATAWRAVESFFSSSPKHKTLAQRKDFSMAIVDGYWYLYANTLKKDAKGVFKSPFVLPVIAKHLEDTAGAIDVPGLYTNPEDDAEWPAGALGLAGAAVFRMFWMYKESFITINEDGQSSRVKQYNPSSGKYSHYHTDFSEGNFSDPTYNLADAASGVEKERRPLILEAARAYLGPRKVAKVQAEPAKRSEGRFRLVDLPE